MKSIAGQLDGLVERLSRLQRGADQNRLRATDARQAAGEAGELAGRVQQVLGSGTAPARVATAVLRCPALARQHSQLCPGTVLDEARRVSHSGHGSCIVMPLLINLMQYGTT